MVALQGEEEPFIIGNQAYVIQVEISAMYRNNKGCRRICLWLVLVLGAFILRGLNDPDRDKYEKPPLVYVCGKTYITYRTIPWPSHEQREEILKDAILIGIIVDLKSEIDDSLIMSSDEPAGAKVYISEEYSDLIFVKSDDRINLYELMTD